MGTFQSTFVRWSYIEKEWCSVKVGQGTKFKLAELIFLFSGHFHLSDIDHVNPQCWSRNWSLWYMLCRGHSRIQYGSVWVTFVLCFASLSPFFKSQTEWHGPVITAVVSMRQELWVRYQLGWHYKQNISL